MAVARLNDADVGLVDGSEGHFADLELPGPESEMDSRRQRIGLQAGLAVQRHDCAIGQSPIFAYQHPLLVDDPDLVLRDNDGPAEGTQNRLVQDQNENEYQHPSVLHDRINAR
jgi:hypothetical protein